MANMRLSLCLLATHLLSSVVRTITFDFRVAPALKPDFLINYVNGMQKDLLLFRSDVSKTVDLISNDANVVVLKTKLSEIIAPLQQSVQGFETQEKLLFTAISDATGITSSTEVTYIAVQGVVMSLALLVGWAATSGVEVGTESPYEVGSTSYDIKKAEEFYNARPALVFSRLSRLAALTSAFNFKLFLDWKTGNLEKNEKERAKEALVLSTKLGPTFIKLGQALSIRTDLIPEAYALELRQLQDAVPPFNSDIAKRIIKDELGVDDLNQGELLPFAWFCLIHDARYLLTLFPNPNPTPHTVFRTITSRPIASASIGQVYKGTLLDGREVAVKVQRPQILGEIALDLYLMRLLTPLQVKVSNWINKRKTSPEDIQVALSLVDEWGRGFVAEVDYRTEARNTKDFTAAMQRRALDAVVAPAVVDNMSGMRVITTEWMDGTRLDRDASPDVPRLCGVAVNAYLTMLLDTGVLHCDPHPGNLLRTKDGRLCVLDWGMTLAVPPELQYGLLEFIAHVISEDYAAMPKDFVNLGFSPSDKLPQLEKSGLTEGLAFALRQLKRGGGAKKMQARVKEEFLEKYGRDLSDVELQKAARADMVEQMQTQLKKDGVDVNDVTGVMEEMSRRNRELFKLPPYVLYVSRAFSTLEGIGLSIDEDYSILQECYPYLSKRLLTDDNPRAQEALRTMLYGSLGEKSGLSSETLFEMSEGFTSYTTVTGSADDSTGSAMAQRQLADLILSTKGNLIQSTLLDETAKLVDAAVRNSYTNARDSELGRFAGQVLSAQSDLVKPFSRIPLLGGLALPALLPIEIFNSVNHILEKDEQDEASLKLAEKLWAQLVERQRASSNGVRDGPSVDDIRGWLQDPNSLLRKSLADESLRNSVIPLGAKFGARLIHRVSSRIENRLTGTDNGSKLVGALASRNIELGRTIARALEPVSK